MGLRPGVGDQTPVLSAAPVTVPLTGRVDGRQNTTAHQRKSFCVKPLVGASKWLSGRGHRRRAESGVPKAPVPNPVEPGSLPTRLVNRELCRRVGIQPLVSNRRPATDRQTVLPIAEPLLSDG